MTGRVSAPRLVGREEELARLRAAMDDAEGGRSRFVVVAGDAGIGKSRLVAELAGSLGDGVHAMVGGCLAISDGGLPYAPLAEALRQLSRELEPATLDRVLGAARPELARLVPDLSVGGDRALGALTGAADRTGQARLFELILGFLGRLSDDGPVLLVIEDSHWADAATRDLLTYLVANLQREPVVVVATLRTDALESDARTAAWLADLLRGSHTERIDLGPLSLVEVGDQLRGILGSSPSPAVTASIAARSGGNALFVEELVAAGVGAGVDPGADSGGAGLPATLRGMLAARIRGLPPDTDAVIRTLAVAGRAVDDRLLVEATGLPEPSVHAALRDAIARHLVDADGRTSLVDLHHVLIREAILAELLAGERRGLHAALAMALTAHPELADPSPAGAASQVAHHWAAADRPVEAFRAARAAADAATAVRAHAEAARHRRRALDLLPRLPPGVRADAPDETALLLDAEDAANLAGDLASSLELLERGLRLADPALDPVRTGILESRMGYHRWLTGRSDEALAHHHRAVELVPPEPPSLARARVVRGLGGALMGLGRYRESAAICEDAIAAARAAGAPVEEGRALDMLGMDRFGIGDVEGGIEALEAACALAREHDPGEGLIVGLQNLAYHLGLADRPEDALVAAEEGIEVARREGLARRYGPTLHAAAADVLLRLGRWDEAEIVAGGGSLVSPAEPHSRLAERAWRADLDSDTPLYLVIVRLRLATARGRFEDARRELAAANAMAAGDVDFDLVAYLRTAEAELACWIGRPDQAASAVDAGLAALEGSDDVFLAAPLLALGAWAAADRAETARAWHDEAALAEARSALATIAARLDDMAPGQRGRASTRGLAATVAWARAELSRAEGVPDQRAWAELADTWLGLGAPASAAYARLRRAEAVLAARGGRRIAAADLADAAATAARLGAEPLGAAVASLARRSRISLAAVMPGAAGLVPADGATAGRGPRSGEVGQPGGHGRRPREALGLTARELEVLELLASGLTNAEIGRALGISPTTARHHVGHILAKLAVTTRAEAAAVAVRVGLADSEVGPGGGIDAAERRAARTFMFTDIVASTALIDVIGDDAWSTLRRWHDATLRRLFAAHGGVEVDHAGDGFFVAFPSPAPGVACAVEIQRTLAEHRRSAGFAPGVRIGLHHGEAVRTGAGWAGREVHVAARLMALADAGKIVASSATLAAARVSQEDAHVVSLRGLAGTVAVATVPWQ